MPKRASLKGRGVDVFFEGMEATAAENQGSDPSQQNSKAVSQHSSTVAEQLVKVTFYLTPDHSLKLDQIRLARKSRGEKVDRSGLVREAIELLASKEGEQ
jgi:hypothetical protein